LVKALVEGLGGISTTKSSNDDDDVNIPPEAMKSMQDSALTAIAAKAGARLPILRGHDKGLPKAPPTFDLDKLREKNMETAKRLLKKGGASV
jgi:hypothetical protein